MKSFQQFVCLTEGSRPIETLAALIRMMDSPTANVQEKDTAERKAQAYARLNNLNIDQIRAEVQKGLHVKPVNRTTSQFDHPDDQFFTEVRNVLQRAGYEFRGDRYRGQTPPNQSGETLYQVWNYKKNSSFELHVANTTNGKTAKPYWYLDHRDRDLHRFSSTGHEPLAQGTDLQSLQKTLAIFEYDSADLKAKGERAERERPKHKELTPEQKAMEAVLFKHGYTLDPPSSADESHRYYFSADRKRKVYVGADGRYYHQTLIAGSWKQDHKTNWKKSPTPADLDKLITKLEGTTDDEQQAHLNPLYDKIIKWCNTNGFKELTMAKRTSLRAYANKSLNLEVHVDRANFNGLGRVKKDEPAYWSTKAYDPRLEPKWENKYGQTFEEFLEAVKGVKGGAGGPEAIAKLIHEYGFAPMDEQYVQTQNRKPGFVWFDIGDVQGKQTIFSYYVGYHKVTGEYILAAKGGPFGKDMNIRDGRDLSDLKSWLNAKGIKPGQHHTAGNDSADRLAKMVLVAQQHNYHKTGEDDHVIIFTNNHDKNSLVNIEKPELTWELRFYDFGLAAWKTAAMGKTPEELATALKHHESTMHSRPGAFTQKVIVVAEDFGFKVNVALSGGEDMVLEHHEDKSVIEINKQLGGWEHYFRKKIIGSGITPEALHKHLEETYGEQK